MTPRVSVTFTGADHLTRGSDICLIAEAAVDLRLPVEMALLCSHSRSGGERYPDSAHALRLARRAEDEGLALAVHLCGAAAKDVLADPPDLSGFGTWESTLSAVLRSGGRVQVNRPETLEPAALPAAGRWLHAHASMFGFYQRAYFIGQHRDGLWPAEIAGVSWLLDRSGGTGVVADGWPELPDYPVGLAGGIGPDSAYAAARHLYASRAGGWIDMETNVRAGGRLCPDLCVRVLREVARARDDVR